MNWFNSPRPRLRALEIVFWIILGGIGGYRWGYASDEVHTTMRRVEAALVAAGYEAAKGYSDLKAPAVEYVDILPGNDWGAYSISTGRIALSRRQPSGCVPVTLAHEISHDLAVRKGLLVTVPTSDLRAEMERIAAVAEMAVDAETYLPNCVIKRHPA